MNPGTPTGPFGRLRETEDEYRHNPAVTNSSVNLFLKNEWLYQQVFIAKSITPEDNTAFTFGRAFHCFVLEPADFQHRYAVWEGIRRGKAWDDFLSKEKREIITKDEMAKIEEMAEAITWNKAAFDLIEESETEVVFRHMCNGNLARQGRVDGITPFGDIIDLKSCQSIEEFESNFRRYGYHRQARWYERLVGAVTGDCNGSFTFIAVEKHAPYRCERFQLATEDRAMADEEIDATMARLERCIETGQFRRNRDEVQYISAYRRRYAEVM
jgi:hypothetical protein